MLVPGLVGLGLNSRTGRFGRGRGTGKGGASSEPESPGPSPHPNPWAGRVSGGKEVRAVFVDRTVTGIIAERAAGNGVGRRTGPPGGGNRGHDIARTIKMPL